MSVKNMRKKVKIGKDFMKDCDIKINVEVTDEPICGCNQCKNVTKEILKEIRERLNSKGLKDEASW